MKKILIAVLATVLICGCVVGGTYAWLIDQTDPITNTFTVGDINITLTETVTQDPNIQEPLKMVPGQVIAKDPKVTVVKESEACWLFVKIEKVNSVDSYLTYSIAAGWTELTEGSGIYYREVDYNAADSQVFSVLMDNQVTVKDTVTKDQLESVAGGNARIALKFTAYAVQKAGIDTVTDAWTKISQAQ